jgi:hypothetical protein
MQSSAPMQNPAIAPENMIKSVNAMRHASFMAGEYFHGLS